jgi:FHA domain
LVVLMTAIADVSYAPGTLTAVAGDRCWVLIDAAPDSPTVDWLWQQLGQRARPEAILAGLLGAGFAGATEFALLYQEDTGNHRLFCRGAVTATVQGNEEAHRVAAGGPAEARRIDGGGLLTWLEDAVPGTVSRILLGAPSADGAYRLPATAGVLLASCVSIDLTGVTTRESAPTRAIRPDIVTAADPSPSHPLPAPADGPPPVAAEEYDFLWGATQARSVSDAAIRTPDADPIRPTAFAPSGAFDGIDAGAIAQTSFSAVASSRLPPAGGLIDAMPWEPDPAAMPWEPGPAAPDETGFTVKRGNPPGPPSWAAPPPDKIGPAVPALICPAGHVNPPSEARCRRCGTELPPDPVVVPRPVLGVLRLSVGDVITLDRGVVMGRNPKSDFPGTDGEERPHVVRLPSEVSGISRTHLRITLDGWHVLVTDLNSTNGTMVTLPGREPGQLRPGQPVPIEPGTVVTLANGIDFRYEVAE